MITSPGNTRFIQSSVAPLGPEPYPINSDEMYPGGMGNANNNDYYPVANGMAGLNQTSEQIRWIRCTDTLWQYEDMCFRPVMQKILAAWAQYNNLYDSDVDKDDWQSKKATPFMFITLEKLAGAFVQFIEQKPGWFKGDASVPPMQLFVDLMTKFLGWWLQHPLVDFFSTFEEAMKSLIMTGHVHMTVTVEKNNIPILNRESLQDETESSLFADSIWQQLSPFLNKGQGGDFTGLDSSAYPFIANPAMPRLVFTVIPTANVRMDSTGRGRYKMWKTIMGVGEFMLTAGDRGWDLRACRDSIGGHSRWFDQEQNQRAMQQGITRSQESNLHTIELLHFEGDLHDPQTGEPLFQKSYMVISNGRQVVYGPSPIPFWDGESIMVSAPFIKNPNAVYGKSFLPESIDMMDVRHDLQNVLLDYVRMSLQPPRQVDKSILQDTAFVDSQYAMYPNRVITIRSNGIPGAQAISPIQNPDLPVGFWQFMQYFQQNQQEMSGMTQELMGAPRTRIRTTGMESDAREAQAGKFLESIWSGVERRFLTPALRLANLRLLQYIGDDMWSTWIQGMKSNILPTPGGQPVAASPQIAAAWSDQLDRCSKWDARTRFRYFGGFFSWKVDIFNNLSQRQSEIEKVTMFLNTLAKIPNAFNSVRLNFFVKKLTEAFGWDPSEALTLDGQPIPNMDSLDALDPISAIEKIFGKGTDSQQASASQPGALDQYTSQLLQSPISVPAGSGSPIPGGPRQPTPGTPTIPPGINGSIP